MQLHARQVGDVGLPHLEGLAAVEEEGGEEDGGELVGEALQLVLQRLVHALQRGDEVDGGEADEVQRLEEQRHLPEVRPDGLLLQRSGVRPVPLVQVALERLLLLQRLPDQPQLAHEQRALELGVLERGGRQWRGYRYR